MNIVSISKKNELFGLYSFVYEDGKKNIYDELFDNWTDVSYLVDYFDERKELLSADIWQATPDPFLAASEAQQEALRMKTNIIDTFEECGKKIGKNLDDIFKPYDSKKSKSKKIYDTDYKMALPKKMYGPNRPSFFRLYALKVDTNCYVVFAGGIKLTENFKDTPGYGDINKMRDTAINYLKKNGIECPQDIYEFVED